MNYFQITIFSFLLTIGIVFKSFGQTTSGEQVTTVAFPVSFSVVDPFSSYELTKNEGNDASEEKSPFNTGMYILNNTPDPVVQTSQGNRIAKAPQISFDGQTGVAPPDPTGAAGPNHYMQAVNYTFQVFDKNGTVLTQAVDASNLWPNDTLEYGSDPVIIYDRHADRWFISQIGIDVQFSWFSMRVAVSQTNDPTGLYNAYSYSMVYLPDYPKFGVWWDGYYMMASTNGQSDNFFVYERDLMLTGDPNARMLTTTLANNFSLPSSADGALPPNGTPCYLFANDFDEFGGTDQILVHEATTNWSGAGSIQFNSPQSILVAPYQVDSDPFQNVAQPMSLEGLNALEGYPFIRAQHLRWQNHNSIVLTVTVRDSEWDLAVRWYELRDALNGNWSIYQQGTYSPGVGHRWFGSAAMDENGNIALAYSYCHSSSGIHPGLRYTGRLNGDPLGVMTFAEQSIVDGLGSQIGSNRYGDYSHMSLDPDGQRLWFTGEYLGPAGEVRTRICAINLSQEVGLTENDSFTKDQMEVSINVAHARINVKIINAKDNFNVELINFQGVIISENIATTNTKGDAFTTFSTNKLSNGVYFVRAIKNGQQIVKRIVF